MLCFVAPERVSKTLSACSVRQRPGNAICMAEADIPKKSLRAHSLSPPRVIANTGRMHIAYGAIAHGTTLVSLRSLFLQPRLHSGGSGGPLPDSAVADVPAAADLRRPRR